MLQGISDKVDKIVESIASTRNGPATAVQAQRSPVAAAPVRETTRTETRTPKTGEPVADRQSASPEEVSKAVEKVNSELQNIGSKLSLAIDRDTHRVLMKFKDPVTGVVERQIPSDVVLEMAKHFDELKGSILNLEG